MKLEAFKRPPVLIACGVIALFCVLQTLRPEVFERVEWMTYDWRVRKAAAWSPEVATNLGFVNIGEDTITYLNKGLAGRSYGLYWPRHVYGRVARELANQGAKAVAFDILMSDLRPDHTPVLLEGMRAEESDDFFANQIREAGNVIVAAEQEIVPPVLFRTNAMALGDITADRDRDGVLRRARAYRTYRKWNRAFERVEEDREYGVDLTKARVFTNQIVLPRLGEQPITIPLTAEGNIDLRDFYGDKLPAGTPRFQKPFTDERVWHMGIVLAAQQLALDLTNAEVELERGRITLHGSNGLTRVLPVDRRGYFYIDWSLPVLGQGKHVTQEPFEGVLAEYQMRQPATSNLLAENLASRWSGRANWQGKLVVIGSTAVGNNLTDRGATPLENDTPLVGKHLNVANSILTGRFIHRAGLPVEMLMIILMGGAAAFLTLKFRSFVGTVWVAAAVLAYSCAALLAYVQLRYWLPMALPVIGGAVMNHVLLLTYVIVFEKAERRRLRSVFTKMVPSEVVAEIEQLADTNKLSLSGSRRNVTVFFADIRGFTELTDQNRDKAADYISKNKLSGVSAETVFDEQARETLDTVNQYLTVIADTVSKHKGTVDKFIGDCVMAFWGAPIPNEKHALACVKAAIDVQRTVFRMNQEREAENKRREEENIRRTAADQKPLSLLPIMVIGSGINTGVVTAGYMGSEERLNYTVFGRDVNLASRLESVSGRGRIIISEATLAEIIQDDPTLALSCVELPPVKVKGIRDAIPIYEVPWREDGKTGQSAEPSGTAVMERDTIYLANPAKPPAE